MITLNDQQIWTIIGVGAATFLGMLTLLSTMFMRVFHTEIRSVHTAIDGLRSEMNIRFDSVRHEISTLDRDVQVLAKREFGR